MIIGYRVFARHSLSALLLLSTLMGTNAPAERDTERAIELVEMIPLIAKAGNYNDPWFEDISHVDRDVMVQKLCDVLYNDERFSRVSVGRIAYIALGILRADETDAGRLCLLKGLAAENATARRLSLVTLSKTLPEHAKEMIPHLKAAWFASEQRMKKEIETKVLSDSAKFVRLLARASGRCGPQCLSFVPFLNHAARNYHPTVRLEAVLGMMQVISIRASFEEFTKPDPTTEKLLIIALGRIVVGENRTRLSDDDLLVAQEKVIDALNSSAAGLRSAALRSLEPIFGDTFVTMQPDSEFALNPLFRDRILEMARNDPEPTIRKLAHEVREGSIMQRHLTQRVTKDQ